MEKKNTLLYLRRELVAKAKKEGLNISRLAEEAIERELRVRKPASAREHLLRLFLEVGSEDSVYGKTHFLPFQIESVALSDFVSVHTNRELHFHKDKVNLISAPVGCGKSTIIWAILVAFGIDHGSFRKASWGDGSVTVKLYQNRDSMRIARYEGRLGLTRGYQCLLADDSLERVQPDMIEPLIADLEHLKIQTIMTVSPPLVERLPLRPDTHLISLENRAGL